MEEAVIIRVYTIGTCELCKRGNEDLLDTPCLRCLCTGAFRVVQHTNQR